ncbi:MULTISPECIES: hypothetical protein [Stenotrophomonas]|jgi:predicted nucleic acid-binding Zn ribbon protein|uniref:hypothetical protein n=1 Tax=Stenotrophomonas TaxID=40323 RepID=UPI000539BC9D|nr:MULTISPECIES: hypothetical protein [Stenotrophomonas]MCV4213742.1 hypothetical protein [Pseudomonas cichorii]ASE53500.1 hypothetical protein CEQ03_12560 [Stenotrophomonas maltophilia]AVH92935.1 hypothetical protein AL480_19865 [Stenotrophomonas maltophilia]EKT4085506.1 hypothetical protein [Stenotrophomonas maltophilia]EKT4101666.1 hypothetical protein [Stenotrophomonas maltophilia]
MHNESPLPIGRVDCQSTREVQPTNSRLYQSQSQSQSQTEAQRHGIEQQRQRARRTAMWVGAIAVLVYVGFILSGVIGR